LFLFLTCNPQRAHSRYNTVGNYAKREGNMVQISRLGFRAMVLAATLALGACIGNAVAQQPHMYAALDALRTARAAQTRTSGALKG
jgi:hypothetical protein